jgi:hypothetical protein
MLKPHASHVFIVKELKILLDRIGAIKFPTNYGSSLVKHMADMKMDSMKSHDYHMLMQQLLPLCMQGLMVVEPRMAIMKLNYVFQQICVKVWNLVHIGNL